MNVEMTRTVDGSLLLTDTEEDAPLIKLILSNEAKGLTEKQQAKIMQAAGLELAKQIAVSSKNHPIAYVDTEDFASALASYQEVKQLIDNNVNENTVLTNKKQFLAKRIFKSCGIVRGVVLTHKDGFDIKIESMEPGYDGTMYGMRRTRGKDNWSKDFSKRKYITLEDISDYQILGL
jgi:hypothetical protein